MSQLSEEERALAHAYGFETFTNIYHQEFVRRARYKGSYHTLLVVPPGHWFGRPHEDNVRQNGDQWEAYTTDEDEELHAPTLAAALARVILEGWL